MANKLQFETSPYLLQHAHNPVDWYPWGEEALQRARDEQKPILISIGYSACHWCHVMERESFEDPATADIMNRHFINIKVDREERPDLDQVYMDAVQAISGSGGWPLNVFLTPEAKPFYGGTYFPPVRAYNRSSWREVLHSINMAWIEKPQEILAQAENLTDHIRNASLFGAVADAEPVFNADQLAAIGMAILKSADKQWGGFGNAPKFPQTMSIQWLLRQYHYFKVYGAPADSPFVPEELLQQATLSLDKMIAGGIYDHLGGGFARYSTDARWLTPHFEKMLYDNALIVSVLAEAYQLTGKENYKTVIGETLDFVSREWQGEDGGFCSAFDADSEGEEGKYYTWQKEEIFEKLDDRQVADLFCDYFDVTEKGNWEATNILWTPKDLASFCEEKELNIDEVRQMLAQAKARLLIVRNEREKPLLDDKRLLGWNALMVTACCKAWAAVGEPAFLNMAIRGAHFIETQMKLENGHYCHNEKNGKAANPAFLDDLAYYTEALCHLQEATGQAKYLELARQVLELIIDNFSDEEGVFFYYTPAFQKDILVRKKETYDGATPAANSVMVHNLHYLGILFDNRAWQTRAERMLAQVQKVAVRYPNSFANWAQMMQGMVYGTWELAIVGKQSSSLAEAVLHEYIPNKVLQHSSGASVVENYPLLANKDSSDGRTLIYACRHYACQAPVDNVEALLSQLGG